MSYIFLEHTADVKFRAEAFSLEEVFVFAADALNETIRGDIKILEQEEENIEISGKDLENLLYNFLEEFLILLDSKDFLVSSVRNLTIDKDNFILKATFVGDKAENYVFTNDVKAITYNEMIIKQIDNKWVCEAVLDV
ncbi:MAG: archease [Candidatus Pacearchaeota archaeon]